MKKLLKLQRSAQAPVTMVAVFNGIRFGAVRSIELLPEDGAVLITIRDDTPVRTNSRARISRPGPCWLDRPGNYAGHAGRRHAPGQTDEKFPAIYADPSSSGSLIAGMTDAAGQANALAGRLNSLVANNEDSIRHTIANLKSFTTMMAERKDDVASILQDVRSLSARLNDISQKVDAAVDRLAGAASRSPLIPLCLRYDGGDFFRQL